MVKYFWLLLYGTCLGGVNIGNSQPVQSNSAQYLIIGFYNVENLFDTIDNALTKDDEFTPWGERRYNTTIYLDKIQKISSVVQSIPQSLSTSGSNTIGISLLGMAEVENERILEDLIHSEPLRPYNYRYIITDGKDARGINIALLYQPKIFTPLFFTQLPVRIEDKEKSYYSRDILYVKGSLQGELVHIFINHWPSRTSGEAASELARIKAAKNLKAKTDSLLLWNESAKIILMGDFNDNPNNISIQKILNAKADTNFLERYSFFNPYYDLFFKGKGTVAFRDAWYLFDQILFSKNWFSTTNHQFYFFKALVYAPAFLLENNGKYKGYPMRSWAGLEYRGGYSDHLPVITLLLKK